MTSHPLAPQVQMFFTARLTNQLGASPNTVAGYRDTFRLLLGFASKHTGRPPTDLQVEDIDAGLVACFLDDLESTRHNSARTRNARLTAIRSFFSHVSRCEPALLDQCRQVLVLPSKRCEQRTIEYLDEAQTGALLAAPDITTRQGRRDRALLLLMVQAGLRVSELTGLDCGDLELGTAAHVRVSGKGRRQRATPLREDAVTVLREWLNERGGRDSQPLFPSNRNRRLSRDTVAWIVSKHVTRASQSCPSLRDKRISPHSLRHTSAMELLRRRRADHRHRAVARPPARRINDEIPARRSEDQGERHGADKTGRCASWALSAGRAADGLSGEPVTMPKRPGRK